ncbi:MAG TPA: long-chain fatty acid--CoA ligase [Pseudonocardiaceae bacterium]|nr:long-chain fatty acid--CoA ligase [Pseudonocardiaceae bacterium]
MANYGLGSWPRRRARINPTGIALRQDDRALTYAELAARVDQLAAALAARGVRKGDRVAYLGLNDIATFEVFFATTLLGAIFAPFNTRLAPPEIAYLVSDARPTVFFDRTGPGDDYEDVLASGAGLPVPETDVALSDDAVVLYTSGTTGRPKGAVLTHANLTFNTMNQLAHADVLSTDTALCMCPLFHATGLGQVSLPTLFKGGTVVVIPKFDAGVVLDLIQRLRLASFSAVPTMLQMLCDHPDFESTDLSSLRFAIYGGSMVAERVAVAWQRRGVDILQGYGMTEASPGVYLAPREGAADKPVSIGVPHFFTDVRSDDGELLVRGLNVFRGYWQRPDDTANAFTDGWYRSGDVVRVDDDGWAYVVDRVKDMIISGGENIYPSEVEAAMNALPGVVDSALIGVPDERWGEVGKAFVIVSDPGWTSESLRKALVDQVAGYKIPKYVEFVDDLPRTATGKVRKQELRAKERS